MELSEVFGAEFVAAYNAAKQAKRTTYNVLATMKDGGGITLLYMTGDLLPLGSTVAIGEENAIVIGHTRMAPAKAELVIERPEKLQIIATQTDDEVVIALQQAGLEIDPETGVGEIDNATVYLVEIPENPRTNELPSGDLSIGALCVGEWVNLIYKPPSGEPPESGVYVVVGNERVREYNGREYKDVFVWGMFRI